MSNRVLAVSAPITATAFAIVMTTSIMWLGWLCMALFFVGLPVTMIAATARKAAPGPEKAAEPLEEPAQYALPEDLCWLDTAGGLLIPEQVAEAVKKIVDPCKCPNRLMHDQRAMKNRCLTEYSGDIEDKLHWAQVEKDKKAEIDKLVEQQRLEHYDGNCECEDGFKRAKLPEPQDTILEQVQTRIAEKEKRMAEYKAKRAALHEDLAKRIIDCYLTYDVKYYGITRAQLREKAEEHGAAQTKLARELFNSLSSARSVCDIIEAAGFKIKLLEYPPSDDKQYLLTLTHYKEIELP